MASLEPFYQFRRLLVDALELDLIGPAGGECEIIDDAPITRYIAGVLYPRDSETLDPDQDVDVAEGDDEWAYYDPPVALSNRRYPSSMGMTFAVDSRSSRSIVVRTTAGRYVPLETGQDSAGTQPTESPSAVTGTQWRREPIETRPITLNITQPERGKPPGIRLADDAELYLFYRIRTADEQGIVPVTLVMLNRHRTGPNRTERDVISYFQPVIEVSAPDAPLGAFVERPATAKLGNDEDVESYRLLYRHAPEFAMGHGCSVRWSLAAGSVERAISVSTTFAPESNVAPAYSNPEIQSPVLGMQYLVNGTREEIILELRRLCDGYRDWIRDRRDEASCLPPSLSGTAELHLERCEDVESRMRAGIEVLSSDDLAWKAFRLANTAMLRLRARTEWLRAGKKTPQPVESASVSWYPFQLAFNLLCLEGIANPDSSDRNLADLLWFPTGGGKTEAYLGLIAFTVFLRRLRSKEGGGVTALMRYTLRLLTIQQFERATLLICCCEQIRATHPELGGDPISVGLWVGQAATPNTRSEAKLALRKLGTGVMLTEGNPVQLHSCPWCGARLDHRNYRVSEPPGARLVISCGRADCEFRSGVPVYLVDDDIYDYRPTLIIATVDKFAALPWRDRTAELFNRAASPDGRALPPELIIQDELHLISGPLGTLVGLYETAVDLLCTQGSIRPKVIASTATIRRAQSQAHGLFDREVRQFPPPGLDARNSYFAVEAPPERRGARMYVGLMAPGASHTTLLVRAYGALLQAAAQIPGPDAVKDPYWTLVGYFNSLRVLGGARMQVQDDVSDRIGLLAGQARSPERPLENRIELTSREPSANIPEHLKAMAVSLPSPDTLDVILATNMISVGVDIDRLGLMVVMGQPQGTSEYIQSTSRVGRKWPGLVIVLLNSSRSRDRSHYESFAAYHSALYRQVEATSVTPFSARARDRGLHAVLVALARMLVPEFRSNNAAERILDARDALETVKDAILDRIAAVAPDELDASSAHLDRLLDEWEERARQSGTLAYRDKDPNRSLLIPAADADPNDYLDAHFPTLWSLRDVDKESTLRLVQLGGSSHAEK